MSVNKLPLYSLEIIISEGTWEGIPELVASIPRVFNITG